MLIYPRCDVSDRKVEFAEFINNEFKKHNWTPTHNQLKFGEVLSNGGFIITKSYRQSGMSTMIMMYICYNAIYGNFKNVAIIGNGQNNSWYRESIKECLSHRDERFYVSCDEASSFSFRFYDKQKTIHYINYDDLRSRVCGRNFDFIAIDNAAFLHGLEREVLFLRYCTNHMLLASCPNPIEKYDFKTIYNEAIRSKNKWRAYSFSWYMDIKKYPKVVWIPKHVCTSTHIIDRDCFINDEYRTEEFAMSMYSDGYIAFVDRDVKLFDDNADCEIYGNFK